MSETENFVASEFEHRAATVRIIDFGGFFYQVGVRKLFLRFSSLFRKPENFS